MKAALLRSGFLLVLALICGSTPTPSFAEGPLAVRTVALIPATDPTSYELTVKTAMTFFIPLAGTAAHFDAKQKTKDFNARLKPLGLALGSSLNARLVEKLTAAGYEVTVLENVPRTPDSPDWVDYETIDFKEDIGLHVRIDAIGYQSGMGSAAFVPRLNVSATSFTRKATEYPYEKSIYYGSDARPGKDWAIVSPESANAPSFEALMADPASSSRTFSEASEQVLDRIVAEFKASSPPK